MSGLFDGGFPEALRCPLLSILSGLSSGAQRQRCSTKSLENSWRMAGQVSAIELNLGNRANEYILDYRSI